MKDTVCCGQKIGPSPTDQGLTPSTASFYLCKLVLSLPICKVNIMITLVCKVVVKITEVKNLVQRLVIERGQINDSSEQKRLPQRSDRVLFVL